MTRRLLNLLTAPSLLLCVGVYVLSAAGCSTAPAGGDAESAMLPIEQFQFVQRLGQQARLNHDRTGRWPALASELDGDSVAALQPIPPNADLRLTRFYPKSDGRLIIERGQTGSADRLYFGLRGDKLYPSNANEAKAP